MARKPASKPARGPGHTVSAFPEVAREPRRSRTEMSFEDQSLLGPLFGQFDANLVQVENRLGTFISARGDRVVIEIGRAHV